MPRAVGFCSCDRHLTVHKAKDISSLAPYRRNLPILVPGSCWNGSCVAHIKILTLKEGWDSKFILSTVQVYISECHITLKTVCTHPNCNTWHHPAYCSSLNFKFIIVWHFLCVYVHVTLKYKGMRTGIFSNYWSQCKYPQSLEFCLAILGVE